MTPPDLGHRRVCVAIDGPSGAGKSTVARAVADALGYAYVDTGAMYRAVGAVARDRGIPLADPDALGRLAAALRFEFFPQPDGGQGLRVDGTDVTRIIRSGEAGLDASAVSAVPAVRDALTAEQRRLGRAGGVVMEGRDVGTVVMPAAEAKIYLDAAAEERGRRRLRDLEARGERTSLDAVTRDLERRDLQDSTREVAPLRPAEDAVRVDSTSLTIDDVVAAVLAVVRERERA